MLHKVNNRRERSPMEQGIYLVIISSISREHCPKKDQVKRKNNFWRPQKHEKFAFLYGCLSII